MIGSKMTANMFTIRNYRPADFESYLSLHLETEWHEPSGRLISTQRLSDDLGQPNFYPQENIFVAELNGRLVGYAGLHLEPDTGRALLKGLIHPLHRRKGVATKLFARARKRAVQAGAAVLQISIPQTNSAAKRMLERLGLKYIRNFLELKLETGNIRLPHDNPGPYLSRSLLHGEEERLTALQNRSFAGSWGFNPNSVAEIVYWLNMSGCSPNDVIMTYYQDTPVGYCWTRIDPAEDGVGTAITGMIHMLGVDPDFRKKGIGKIVLAAGLSYLKRKGLKTVVLTVDSQNPAALALYESTGFTMYSETEWYELKLEQPSRGG
jgi:mycothiol synthase